jgi:hypothetical protein
MKQITRILFVLCISFCLHLFSPGLGNAQYVRDSLKTNHASEEAEPASWPERLVPGGNFGFNFGTQWFIDLSPSLGYQITNHLVAGAGLIYNAYGGTVAGRKISYQRYGGFSFARQRIYQSFFASSELELLNVPDESRADNSRVWIFSPLAGLSYIMPFHERGGLQVSFLYNLNFNPDLSPFPSPFVWRIGFFL